MSWGNRLLITFIVFGSGMIYLVYRCMNTEFELVEKDYYKNELAYQEVIDASKRSAALNSAVKLTKTGEEMRLLLPAEMKGKKIEGEIWFYCAYDSKKDKRLSLKTDEEGVQVLPVSLLLPGRYLARISWKDGTDSYYQEIFLTIN
ncbi:FixH family protein [Terrimonas sp. NA20]|uniref:FixH family protein n=1 Tax=Terrimonas ginsenosidimutans TaxID=2908004 RepID=A0ABS9KSR6_9BACT|nr:FixH family protein [Terrimonas ginsenosidimutans]MCG2615332.1 FixH family protein [Terrimonas ginsenosidimutans]